MPDETPPPYIDQAQLKADTDTVVPWAEQSLNRILDPIPENIQVIFNRWLSIIQALTDDDGLRDDIVAFINAKTGAVPPVP